MLGTPSAFGCGRVGPRFLLWLWGGGTLGNLPASWDAADPALFSSATSAFSTPTATHFPPPSPLGPLVLRCPHPDAFFRRICTSIFVSLCSVMHCRCVLLSSGHQLMPCIPVPRSFTATSPFTYPRAHSFVVRGTDLRPTSPGDLGPPAIAVPAALSLGEALTKGFPRSERLPRWGLVSRTLPQPHPFLHTCLHAPRPLHSTQTSSLPTIALQRCLSQSSSTSAPTFTGRTHPTMPSYIRSSLHNLCPLSVHLA